MSEEAKGNRYDHLTVSELKHEPDMSPEFRAVYQKFEKRILWIDDNVVPDAFQMNTSLQGRV